MLGNIHFGGKLGISHLGTPSSTEETWELMIGDTFGPFGTINLSCFLHVHIYIYIYVYILYIYIPLEIWGGGLSALIL